MLAFPEPYVTGLSSLFRLVWLFANAVVSILGQLELFRRSLQSMLLLKVRSLRMMRWKMGLIPTVNWKSRKHPQI